ncbi:long-chain-fatty-acid--CoA ligase [Dietzia maris]|uniref:long-chain-fatty-acid--CoA ligase n=1 Tax=Dietzia maris TaxID=37915 RepID=UPI00223BD56F|nr:long-chain fatty acid--CoA ligase [Dietzia maris]MCT1433490.1 long-chain fatty acid--CoA ligase [Dietzia maris]MCT1520574.1 long-chain fatty acid--CoA ligase [Dietzia maris]
MTNLATLLDESARRFPNRDAIVLGDTRLDYATVNRRANAVANLLVDRGIGPGDKVALSCPNLPHFSIIYYGILKAGATVVPLNILLKSREIAYHLDDSDARAFFCFEGTPDLPMREAGHQAFTETEKCAHFFLITADPDEASPTEGVETLSQALRDLPATFETLRVDPDDTAVILYTSGTTGKAKGAEIRHRNILDNTLTGATLFGADADKPDSYMCVLPLFHTFGQTVIQNGAFAYGGTIVMMPRFEATEALRLMAREGVTFFAGVPTMYWGLLNSLDEAGVDVAEVTRQLRVAVSGGAALPVEVHKQFERRFGITILEGYGLSETSPVASFSPRGAPARPGSIGVPIPGVEMKLIDPNPDKWVDADGDVGEIAIKGHNVMKGYYNRPEATAQVMQDGWFRSGDLARVDDDGWYFIVDRSKDMIVRGGYNVYPREIEEHLLTHPDVSLCAVIGTPHHSLGEEIRAVVIRAANSTLTEEGLIAWAKEGLAAYKYPRYVEFRDTLPMTATGKILKREIR